MVSGGYCRDGMEYRGRTVDGLKVRLIALCDGQCIDCGLLSFGMHLYIKDVAIIAVAQRKREAIGGQSLVEQHCVVAIATCH